MARLNVYPMPGKASEGYVLDVQANLLSHLTTRNVVPLLPEKHAPKPITDLNPTFRIGDAPYVMVTQAIATIPVRELKRPVASLVPEHDRVIRALDILLIGF